MAATRPPPRLHSALLANSVFRTENLQFCAVEVFDRIVATGFPWQVPGWGLLLVFEGGMGEYEMSVDVLKPDGNLLSHIGPMPLRFAPGAARCYVALTTRGPFVFPVPGRYRFQVRVDGSTLESDRIYADLSPADDGARAGG